MQLKLSSNLFYEWKVFTLVVFAVLYTCKGAYISKGNACLPNKIELCSNQPISRQSCIRLGCCYRYFLWKGNLCYRAQNIQKIPTIISHPTVIHNQKKNRTTKTLSNEKSSFSFVTLLKRTIRDSLQQASSYSCLGGQQFPRQLCGGPFATSQWCNILGCCWIQSFFTSRGVCMKSKHSRKEATQLQKFGIKSFSQLLSVSKLLELESFFDKSYTKQARNLNSQIIEKRNRVEIYRRIHDARSSPSKISGLRPVDIYHTNSIGPLSPYSSPNVVSAASTSITTTIKPTSTCNLQQNTCCVRNSNSPCCQKEFHSNRRPSPSTRVVGGNTAGHLRSSMAYISNGPYTRGYCGGTLITNNWVLTAAHCVVSYCNGFRRQPLMVSLGKTNSSPYYRDQGQQDIMVSQVICHSQHCKQDNQPRLNDLALLHLQRSAYSSHTVKPAAIPLFYEKPTNLSKCITMGYGLTRGTGSSKTLQEVEIPLIPNERCNQPDWRSCVIRPCMICAGDQNKAPCDGDSGGPLFCQRKNGLYVVHGVYSWGRCGIEKNKPSVFTRISYYIGWISDTIKLAS